MNIFLSQLGLSHDEEQVYLECLRYGPNPIDVASVASRLNVPTAAAEAAIDRLVGAMLLHRDPGGQPRSVPPEIAVEALTNSQLGILKLLSGIVEPWAEIYHSAPVRRSARADQRVLGRRSVLERQYQVFASAKREVCCLVREPYFPGVTEPGKVFALVRGVTVRTIYTAGAVTAQEHEPVLRSAAQFGEQARVAPSGFDSCFTLADRTRGLVLAPGAPQSEEGLLVVGQPVTGVLAELFDALWRAAIPIDFAGPSEEVQAGLTDNDVRLAILVASHLKDAAIARQLGCGERTVQRRIAVLRRAFGARSRAELVAILASNGLAAVRPLSRPERETVPRAPGVTDTEAPTGTGPS